VLLGAGGIMVRWSVGRVHLVEMQMIFSRRGSYLAHYGSDSEAA